MINNKTLVIKEYVLAVTMVGWIKGNSVWWQLRTFCLNALHRGGYRILEEKFVESSGDERSRAVNPEANHRS